MKIHFVIYCVFALHSILGDEEAANEFRTISNDSDPDIMMATILYSKMDSAKLCENRFRQPAPNAEFVTVRVSKEMANVMLICMLIIYAVALPIYCYDRFCSKTNEESNEVPLPNPERRFVLVNYLV